MKRESNRNVKLANLSWGQYGYSKSSDGHSLGQQLQGNNVHLCVCTYADFPHIVIYNRKVRNILCPAMRNC